jgi:hypothetical protein
MSYVYPPVPIDNATLGIQPASPLSASGQVTSGPFLFAGKLWVFLQSPTLAGTCDVYKSLDNGVTWVASSIGGSGAGITFAVNFDGVHTVRVAWCGDTTAVKPIQFQDFNLSTETWSVATGGGPNAEFIYACQVFSNGKTLIVYEPTGAAHSRVSGVIYDAGFGAPFAMDAHAATFTGAGFFAPTAFAYGINPANTIMSYTFVWTQIVGPGNFTMFDQVDDTGAFVGSAFSHFTPVPVGGIPVRAIPVVYGNFVVLASNASPGQGPMSVIIGTPATAPVFGAPVVADPGYPGDPNLISITPPQPIVSGGILYLISAVNDSGGGSFNRLRIVQTASIADPSIGWSGTTVFDGLTQGGPGWIQNSISSASMWPDTHANLSVGFTSPSITAPGNPLIRYWLQNAFFPVVLPFLFLNAQALPTIPLPNPAQPC